MADNNQFDFLENEDENVQAVEKSELIPIYDNMEYAGDIQPLEDISFEPNKDLINDNNSDDSADKKTVDLKKKIKAIKKVLHKKAVRTALLIAVIVIAVTAGGFGAYQIFGQGKEQTVSVKCVYISNEGGTVILLDNGNSVELNDAVDVKVSENGEYIYYTKQTVSKTGNYDLYCINSTSSVSVEKLGSFVEKGIDSEWSISADGKFSIFTKTQNSLYYYYYSAEDDKAELINDAVVDLYMPDAGNTVYFTRKKGSGKALFRKTFGEKIASVAETVTYTGLYNGENGYEILFTVPGENAKKVNVYSIKGNDNPTEICADVSEVYVNDYEYGGNLYFLKKGTPKVDWNDFIDDSYIDSDASIVKPNEDDFMVERGFLIKKYVLDEVAYNEALKAYNKKIVRDSIRNALDSIDFGKAVEGTYDCFVYSNAVTTELAFGITPNDVYMLKPDGEPEMIYRKTSMSSDEKVSMDRLVRLAEFYGIDSVTDYAEDLIASASATSSKCMYSGFNGNKVRTYQIDNNSDESANYFFGRNCIYCNKNGELNCSKMTSSKLEAETLIDTGVSGIKVSDDGSIYYLVDSGESKNLYRHTVSDGKTKICSDVNIYNVINKNYVAVVSADGNTYNIGCYDGTGYRVLDTDIIADSFTLHSDSFTYFKNYSPTSGGELYSCGLTGDVSRCADGVLKVIYKK